MGLGINVLQAAQNLIRPETILYFRFQEKVTNEIGVDVPNYAPGVKVQANVQPVQNKLYERMGLDYTKRYIKIFTLRDIEDLARARAGDQIEFKRVRYELSDQRNWFISEEWNAFVAVQVSPQ